MSTSSEKLDKFMLSILGDAESESSLIMDEVRQKREADKEVAEDEILNETFRYIKARVGTIKTETGRRVSKKVLDNKRTIYARREEIMNKVFAQVRARLDEYVKSPDYPAQLIRLAADSAESLGGQSVVFYLRKQDMKYSDDIKAALPGHICVIREGDFVLGGIIAECAERHLRADDSFDSAYDNVQTNFAEILGFSVS